MNSVECLTENVICGMKHGEEMTDDISDMIKVVRCKNCYFADMYKNEDRYCFCRITRIAMNCEGFCSNGRDKISMMSMNLEIIKEKVKTHFSDTSKNMDG